MPALPPRLTAARIVRAWLASGDCPDHALAGVRRHHAFVLEVAQGTTRWFRALDFLRGRLVARRPRPGTDALLLTALYQLFYLDPGDEHAVVNETVEAAKREGGEGMGRLCNGALRNAVRRRDALRAELAAQPFGVRCSHPDVLLARWGARWTPAQLADLCDWNNRPPDVTVRVRGDRTDAASFIGRLGAAGIPAHPHPHAPDEFVVLPRGVRPHDLPGYDDGSFTVQDPATAAAPRLLDVRPGHRVLDLCAAPGGKTALLAEAAGPDGHVVACDVSARRLNRLRENLRRLGLSAVEVVEADAAADPPAGGEGFDRLLLDVPCSNTGVLRRRPDARWRFDPSTLAELVGRQRRLLDQAARRLLPAGRLVYSTCSLEPEENGGGVRAWLADHPGWTLEAETERGPLTSATDGAYAARLAPP